MGKQESAEKGEVLFFLLHVVRDIIYPIAAEITRRFERRRGRGSNVIFVG